MCKILFKYDFFIKESIIFLTIAKYERLVYSKYIQQILYIPSKSLTIVVKKIHYNLLIKSVAILWKKAEIWMIVV